MLKVFGELAVDPECVICVSRNGDDGSTVLIKVNDSSTGLGQCLIPCSMLSAGTLINYLKDIENK
jgi:hypothetical protein